MDIRTYTHDPDRLIDEHETATLLGLSVRTLQAWRLRSEGPAFVRLGRAVRYQRGEIRLWIERHTSKPASSVQARGGQVA